MPPDIRESFESGIPFGLIKKYLCEELALKMTREGDFCFGGAFVRITALSPRMLGRVELPRTEIRVWGRADDARKFQHAFLMRFLSAGG